MAFLYGWLKKGGGEQRNAEESRLLQVSERYQHRSKESVQARQEEAIQRERESETERESARARETGNEAERD